MARPLRLPRMRSRISTRIFLSFVTVLSLFSGLALLSGVEHYRHTQTLQVLRDGYLPVAQSLGEARAFQGVFRRFVDRVDQRAVMNASSSRWLPAALAQRNAGIQRALHGVERARRLVKEAEERRLLRELRQVLVKVRERYADSAQLYRRLRRADALSERLNSQLRDSERGSERLLAHAWNRVHAQIAQTGLEAARRTQDVFTSFIAVATVALLMGLLMAWRAHNLVTPLPQLRERVAAIAEGRPSSQLASVPQNELGELAQQFEHMVEVLAKRDESIRQAAQARRQLQRMQAQILGSLNVAVSIVDSRGLVRLANAAADPILSVTSKDIGRRLGETGCFLRFPALEEPVAAIARGAPSMRLCAVKSSEEPLMSINVTLNPFEVDNDALGGGCGVLLIVEDVTEELETKARLIHSEQLAAMGRMAAHITHEVRNPLSSIALNVELMEETPPASVEAKELRAAVRKEVDRLTQLTEEYLRVARLPEPQLRSEDLGEIVHSVGTFVQAELQAFGIALDVHVATTLPPVGVDEPQVRQALLNLIRNAREVMPSGGRITIEVEPSEAGVCLRVRDEGPGMDETVRARIFDLFFTTKDRGSGLGLSITRQILHAHGGWIRCLPSPGQGSIFELWVPEAKPNELRARERSTIS